MNDSRIIAVAGATGQQGGATVRELLAAGRRVRALTRNAKSPKAQTLTELGAEIVQADMDDAASVERALRGAWGVFSVQNTWEAGVEKEEVQGRRIAEIAKKVGVQHFVYTSVASADRKTGIAHFDNKWRVEEFVRGLGLPSYTILRPVFFMENFTSPWFKPGIDQGKLALGLNPDTVLQMIAVADIGKYARWAFENPQKLNGRALDIAGDELTMPETAAILGKAAGKAEEFVPVPLEEVRKFSADMAAMFEWFIRVGYNADITARAKESGIPPSTLEKWAQTVDWR
jgi:uncharacterized protein YbjT (DUF2867 family)